MTQSRKAVGALIIYNNQILLARKVTMMDGKGGPEQIPPLWDFPKGGLKQSDKTHETAVLRELQEEVGSDAFTIIKALPDFNFDFPTEIAKKIGFTKQVTYMFLVNFTGDPSKIAPQDEEIDTLTFFTKKDALKRVTFDNSREYIERNM